MKLIKQLEALRDVWPKGSDDYQVLDDAIRFINNAHGNKKALEAENTDLAAELCAAHAHDQMICIQAQILAEENIVLANKVTVLTEANKPLELHGPKTWDNQLKH